MLSPRLFLCFFNGREKDGVVPMLQELADVANVHRLRRLRKDPRGHHPLQGPPVPLVVKPPRRENRIPGDGNRATPCPR